MSTETRLKSLIERLIVVTRDGRLEWKPTSDEDSFRVTFHAGNISIKKTEGFDPEDMESYLNRSLSVFNEKGRLIEEYIPSFDGMTINEIKEFDELFTLARRSAFNTDDVLDALMGEIDSKVPA